MTNSKKIAVFITSSGWGGLEMNTIKLCRLLREKKFDLTLFTQKDASILQHKEEIFEQVEVIQKRRKYFDLKSAKIIAECLKQKQISVIFVVDNKDLDALAWTKRLFYKELRIVYQQHMQIGINKKDFLHSFRFKSIDTWISPLPFLKVEIGLRTHFPLNRVEVVPIGLNTTKFLTKKYTKTEAREKLGIKTDLPLLGIIGRISQKKGQRFVAEALQAMREKGGHAELVIFGSATVNDNADKIYTKDLHNYVENSGLSKVVHFVEYQKDVHLFYNAIDVFVLASHSETYGMVTIEAMLSGLPIVATNSGGTPEILDKGKMGYLYPYENQEKFISKVKLLLNEMETTREMTRLAKENATLLYDELTEVQAIERILLSYLK